MKVVIDSNVILDVFQNRVPFVQFSSRVLRLAETKQIKGYVTANSITDIHYLLGRHLKNKKEVHEALNTLLQLVDIIDVTAKDVRKAFHPDVGDFEDELISVCAERAKMEYIITRNIKDFTNSHVTAITPDDFLEKFYEHL